MSKKKFSVIIPSSKNETNFSLLKTLKNRFSDFEIILVIDASHQLDVETLNEINLNTNKLIKVENSTRGKALNAGAEQATNDYVWFLHIDSNIDKIQIDDFDRLKKNSLGYFKLAFDNKRNFINAKGANLRSEMFDLPFGDQSFLLSKNLYHLIGRFDEELKEGEDHKFIWNAKALGVEIMEITREIKTSARKYDDDSAGQTFKTFFKTIKQAFGFKSESIKNIYCFFTKDPKSLESKTRLRKAVNDNELINNFNSHCLNILKKNILDLDKPENKIVIINGGSHNGYLDKLGLSKYSIINFPGLGLGKAMEEVYELCSPFADHFIIAGSDIPQLESKHLKEAVSELKSYDSFIIPSKDGGFCCFSTKLKTLENIFNRVQYGTNTVFNEFTKNLYNYKKADYQLIDVDTLKNLQDMYNELRVYKKINIEQKALIDFIDKRKYH
ncbi:MAG: DUF2064 domain-containing protein [Pelagibacteraceae bacterium]